MTGTWKRLMVLGLAAAAAIAAGCGGKTMGRYDVVVNMDQAMVSGATPTVAVNIIGISETDSAIWSQKSMGQYFQPNDKLRADNRDQIKELTFGQGRTGPQTLSASDPLWAEWSKRKATHLFVLANLPGVHQDMPGEGDGRRLILPLDTSRWEGKKIVITVQRSRLRCENGPLPEKTK